VDNVVIHKLYEASVHGVKLTLIVRGICVLVPGVKGLSENIEAFSIVDRYLEHSRVYCFANGGNKEIFISSADWMIRNFDNRFEVACPIHDPIIKEDIYNILVINTKDNQKARLFSSEYINIYKQSIGEPPFRAQKEIYNYLKNKTSK
jgi:polyphosphate kinase